MTLVDLTGLSVIAPLSKREAFAHAQRWRETFCSRVKEVTGKWVIHGMDWHSFASGYAEASVGQDAIDQFLSVGRGRAILRVEDGSSSEVEILDAERFFAAWRVQPSRDLYVSDPDLHWTFVMPHEVDHGAGPYFAQRER